MKVAKPQRCSCPSRERHAETGRESPHRSGDRSRPVVPDEEERKWLSVR